ncbi:MAG: hypothetical protein GY820_46610 [Gammaproteobacteria bacterium]|nr:hypothetical protein [Gammaproteobacteria bacterium]
MVPIEFPDHITVCKPEGTRLTRQSAAIHDHSDVTTYRSSSTPSSDALKHSYFFRTMLRWNSMPVDIRQSDGLPLFKSKLMSYLWSPDVDWPD